MDQIFFSGWQSLIRTLVVGILAYATLIIFLRISGKRTLSRLNAFDLIVTFALGSTLASVLLTKDVTLADGALAFAVLIGLQFAVTWTTVRAHWLRRLVTGEPIMLLYRGEFLQAALRTSRVTEEEVLAAIRSAGVVMVAHVEAVVLETDGTFSVVRSGEGDGAQSLAGVRGPHLDRSPQMTRHTVAKSEQ